MKRLILLLISLALFAWACSRPTPTATPAPPIPSPTFAPPPVTAGPTPVTSPPRAGAPLAIPRPPDRDLYGLTQRLRLKSTAPIPRVVNRDPVSYAAGRKDTFWAVDLDQRRPYTISAELRLVTAHAYWYIEDGFDVPLKTLAEAAKVFEERIYPSDTRYFGTAWVPGVDNDPHLTILHGRIRGAAGYYSSVDEYPTVVNRLSNQREMIYINLDGLPVGSSSYYTVLTHEFQHAIHWRADPTEESWVNEGLSELAVELAGFRSFLVDEFLRQPGISLLQWPDQPRETAPHYGAANTFFRYLTQHYGGPEKLRQLVEEPLDGVEGVDAYLAGLGYKVTFRDVFKDWIVANYLGQTGDGPYAYKENPAKVTRFRSLSAFGSDQGSVSQFGTQYINVVLPGGDARLSFQGAETVPLLPTSPPGGTSCWWGNRGDAINSRLTWQLDLRRVPTATLEFKAWYDIEEGWDYAYAEVSQDGGATWDILKGTYASPENPVGNSFGPGFTGHSNGWVQERIDLSLYTGRQVLLRFEYVTDDAINLDGICFDDIAVPEVGFSDGAEAPSKATVEGFVRLNNVLPQEYIVRVIEIPAQGGPQVVEMPLDARNRGELLLRGFGKEIKSATVVISGATALTTQLAPYTLTLSPLP
ncbi:MAG: immune inhibitor A [Chloroflexi bacterium]|nr:immune inhibitor A [Chloroflexota bacterium]